MSSHDDDFNDGDQPYLVDVTQYLRPNRRTREMQAPVFSKEDYDKAQEIIKLNARFEAEVLTTGEVSMTVAYDDEDIAIEISSNGPEIHEKFAKLINTAYDKLTKTTI